MKFNKKLIIITKDDVIVEKVEDYHNIVAREFIRKYFDSNVDILEEASKNNISYAEYMSENYGIVVIVILNNYASMYIPSDFNDYQLEQIKAFNDMVKDFREDNITYSAVPMYQHNVYYDINEFLKYNTNKKR